MSHLHSKGVVWGADFHPDSIGYFALANRLKAVNLESAIEHVENVSSGHINPLCSFANRPSSLFTPPEVFVALLSGGKNPGAFCPLPSVATDSWSLGVLLLEIERDEESLTDPFNLDGHVFSLSGHISDPLEMLAIRRREDENLRVCASAVGNASLRQVLMKLLSANPKKRLQAPNLRSLFDLFGPMDWTPASAEEMQGECFLYRALLFPFSYLTVGRLLVAGKQGSGRCSLSQTRTNHKFPGQMWQAMSLSALFVRMLPKLYQSQISPIFLCYALSSHL